MRFRRPSAALVRRLLLIGAALATALVASACGELSHPTSSDNEGVYVDAGPITYQVQISRELNPYNVEDKGYLVGVNATPPTAQQEWFAVFVWAKNYTHEDHLTTTSFAIVDTQGHRYYPVAINSAINPYAWTSQALKPNGTEPTPDSTAYYGPTQGKELLFKLDDTIYSNRPLTLEIYAKGQSKPSTVSLDL